MKGDPMNEGRGKSDAPPAMTAQQARELLATEQKARAEQCGAALREVLQAHGCALEAKITIVGDRVSGEVLVIPVN